MHMALSTPSELVFPCKGVSSDRHIRSKTEKPLGTRLYMKTESAQ